MINLHAVLGDISRAGGSPLLVGGCVRDKLMGLEPKDIDVEVYGMDADSLKTVLGQHGKVDAVGAAFGILKLGNYDFSLPRRENKQGAGHRGFMVDVDPTMTVEEAASRRDFTINSMAQNPFTGEIYDPFDGRIHLENAFLCPTSPAFKEDPLRVLRGMQFAGRFNMMASSECVRMSKEIAHEYPALAVERVWGEWEKWALRSTHPMAGLTFLDEVGWLHLYPELWLLDFTPQDKDWHPEGNAWVHTKFVVEAMGKVCDRENIQGEQRLVLMFAALTHDLGKPSCTEWTERKSIMRWTSNGHEQAGVPIAEAFLKSIGCLQSVIDKVLPLVGNHLAHIVPDMSKRYIRRLSLRLYPATLVELDMLIEADMSGRPPLPAGKHPASQKMLALAKEEDLGQRKPEPLVKGRHLIELGMKPGPEMGIVLKALFEKQLDCEFSTEEEGLEFAKALVFPILFPVDVYVIRN